VRRRRWWLRRRGRRRGVASAAGDENEGVDDSSYNDDSYSDDGFLEAWCTGWDYAKAYGRIARQAGNDFFLMRLLRRLAFAVVEAVLAIAPFSTPPSSSSFGRYASKMPDLEPIPTVESTTAAAALRRRRGGENAERLQQQQDRGNSTRGTAGNESRQQQQQRGQDRRRARDETFREQPPNDYCGDGGDDDAQYGLRSPSRIRQPAGRYYYYNYNGGELEPAFLRESDYPAGWMVYHPILGVVLKTAADQYDASNNRRRQKEEANTTANGVARGDNWSGAASIGAASTTPENGKGGEQCHQQQPGENRDALSSSGVHNSVNGTSSEGATSDCANGEATNATARHHSSTAKPSIRPTSSSSSSTTTPGKQQSGGSRHGMHDDDDGEEDEDEDRSTSSGRESSDMQVLRSIAASG